MEHARLLAIIRNEVRKTFQANGVTELDDCCETILIREGFYCGRRFTCDGHRAVWFLEEQVVKFYSPDGEYLQSQSTGELVEDRAAAA